jgi:4-aminobutyrate aminotransferase/(S)-3-amino-2-methylpropionate transaminase
MSFDWVPSIRTEIPGPKSRELLALKDKYVSRGPANTALVFAEEAKGALVRDIDGNVYIDFASGIGVVNVGHSPREVVEAVKEQSEKFLHTCFHVVMYESYVRLAEKLAQITPGDFPKKTILINSGAEAVENAVKLSRKYTGRTGVVSLECAFHGRTLMAMTLTSKVKPYKFGFGPFAPDVYKIPSAYCYRCYYRSAYPGCGMACVAGLERFFVSEYPAENVAAVMIEPVQGEGGFIVQPPEFMRGIKDICQKNGIVFIADEIQTGFGRTGKLFAVEHAGVIPDLITLSKSLAAGLPLSAVTGRAEILDAPHPGEVGGTFGGNPVACAAALQAIKLIEEKELARAAEAIGGKMIGRLKEMQGKYPLIGDVRGLGAMVAVELVKDRGTKEPAKEAAGRIVTHCWKNGLLVLSAGIYGNVVRILSPLVITGEELETGLDILEDAFNRTANQ